MLRQRLFTPKAERLKAWTESQQRRIASNEGGHA